MGQQKLGHDADRGGRMTRKEYQLLAEHHARRSSASEAGSVDGDGDNEKPVGMKRQRPSSAPSGMRSGKMEQSASTPAVPPIVDKSANTTVNGKAESGAGKIVDSHQTRAKPMVFVGGSPEDNQKAPPAPAWSIRNSGRALKADARPPRFHVSPLGAVARCGPIQPPLGATMGHGLMRDGSAKSNYFFPSSLPSPTSGVPSSPASGRAPSSGRSPISGQRPASANPTRMNSEPVISHGSAWVTSHTHSRQGK
jgi:hypothetical protein